MTNLHGHIAALAEMNPQKTALISCDEAGNQLAEITYAQLLKEVERAAAGLNALGLKEGDKVALKFENCPELLIVSWAAWSMGVVTVPLDTKRDTDELYQYKLNLSHAKAVITQEDVRSWSVTANMEWRSDLSHDALILFTSGTTAQPKGAILTLENLAVNAKGIVEWLGIAPSDRFLVQLPLHHINSTTFCLSMLLAGGCIIIPPRYSNSRFWEQAANTGATITSIVQSIVFDQLQRKTEYAAAKDRLKLTRIQIGSAPVVPVSALEFMQEFSIPLYQGYGQTETALRVTGVPMGLPKDLYKKLVAENSIGTPMNWAKVAVADAKGAAVPEGKEGELLVKGPAVMKGYLGGEPAFRDGYFLTGDIGLYRVIEGRKFFFLRGRKSEMIIKGGINISPAAVENALKKISGDLDQAYVVGVEDERYGEEVGAVVCFKSGADEESAKRRFKFILLAGTPHLSAYETPKFLRVLSTNELPMTSTGKVQRTVLKKSPPTAYEPVSELMHTPRYRFVMLDAQSPHAEASRALYNHCWQPLILDPAAYRKKLGREYTVVALDAEGTLAGQISFNRDDGKLTCVSICSATFKPKPVPPVEKTPSKEEVEKYLLAGHDPVMSFHTKMGAKLMEVISQGRPEDKSALGYTMLLKYPLKPDIKVIEDDPASNQLIELVRLLAYDIGAEVYALSRPGNLAAYLSQK